MRTGAVLSVVMLIPLVAAGRFAGGAAVAPATMALLSATVLPFCNRRQALFFAGGLVATGMLATAAAGQPRAVIGVVVLACLAAGLSSRVSAGVFGVAPIVAAVLGVNPPGASPLRVGVVMALVCAYIAAVVIIAGVHLPPTPLPTSVAARHGVVMALACGAATAVALHYEWSRAYWLVTTLAVVLRPYASESLRRSRDRIAGTLAGAIMAGLMSPLPRAWLLILIAVCLTLMLAYALLNDYLLQVSFMTATVVLLVGSGSGGSPLVLDGLRVLYVLVGCLVGGGLALLLARQQAVQE